MAVSLGEAILKIGADSSSYERKLARLQGLAKKHMDDAADAVLRSTKTMMLAGAGVIAAGVAAILDSVKFGAELADTMDEMSQRTGIAAGSLMKYASVMELAGGNAESLEGAVRKMQKAIWGKGGDEDAAAGKFADKYYELTKRMRDIQERYDDAMKSAHVNVSQNSMGITTSNSVEVAQARAKAQREYEEATSDLADDYAKLQEAANADAVAFQKLGLSQKALQDMSQEDSLKAVLTALAQIPNAGERAALAMQVFGKGGTVMLPLVANGVDELNRMLAEAAKRAVAPTAATARLADEFMALGQWVNSVRMTIANALAPTVERYILLAQDWIAANRELIGIKVAEWVAQAVAIIKEWAPKIGEAIGKLWEMRNVIGFVAAEIVALAAAWKAARLAMMTYSIGATLVKVGLGATAEAALKGGIGAAASATGSGAAGVAGIGAGLAGGAMVGGLIGGGILGKKAFDAGLANEGQQGDPLWKKSLGAVLGGGGRAMAGDSTSAKVVASIFNPIGAAAGWAGTLGNKPQAVLGPRTMEQALADKAARQAAGATTINIGTLQSHANDPAQLEKDITKQAAKKLP